MASYGQDATGDVDGDGTTNVSDLLLLLAGYGSECTRDAGGGGATCAAGGCATSADVSIVVDNSHTSYCNGGAMPLSPQEDFPRLTLRAFRLQFSSAPRARGTPRTHGPATR